MDTGGSLPKIWSQICSDTGSQTTGEKMSVQTIKGK